MKALFFLLIILVCAKSYAQNTMIKLYAYQQKIHAGVNNQTININEPLQTTETNSSTTQYYLYVQANRKSKLTITRLWIRKQPFIATMALVKTPVTITKAIPAVDQPATDTLVKSTPDNVWQLFISSTPHTTTKGYVLNKKINSQEILVEYRLNNGALQYISMFTIKKLADVAMQ